MPTAMLKKRVFGAACDFGGRESTAPKCSTRWLITYEAVRMMS